MAKMSLTLTPNLWGQTNQKSAESIIPRISNFRFRTRKKIFWTRVWSTIKCKIPQKLCLHSKSNLKSSSTLFNLRTPIYLSRGPWRSSFITNRNRTLCRQSRSKSSSSKLFWGIIRSLKRNKNRFKASSKIKKMAKKGL